MKKREKIDKKIQKLAAEAALILQSLDDPTLEEVEIVAWLMADEILRMTRETKGGVTKSTKH